MKRWLIAGMLLCLICGCSRNPEEPLCPRHIEIPFYPPIANSANISGTVALTLTIDAEGKVEDVNARTTDSKVPGTRLLETGSVANIRRWTFAKPRSAPYTQTISYRYEITRSLPPDGPANVTFDLPHLVTIATGGRSAEQ